MMREGLSALIALCFLFAGVANAGQPWFGSPEGIFYKWNGAVNWVNSGGDLAPGYSNEKGVAMIQEAFDIWSKAGLQNPEAGGFVDTSAVQAAQQGYYEKPFSTDPADPNYYLSIITNPNLPPLIILDKDGSILKDFSKYAKVDLSTVVAYTLFNESKDLDPKSHAITHGVTILNGAMMNKNNINEARFKASVIHEIGHLLGLDHSGLNDTYSVNKERSAPLPTAGAEVGVPTMYPANVSEAQATLHNDDSVAISSLYPTEAFSGSFCTITGNIMDSKGVGVQGLEVIAWAESPANAYADSLSTMTGVNYPVPTNDGHYTIRGIVPKRVYTVAFGTPPKFNSDGSGIGEFSKAEGGVAPPILGTPPITDAPEGICFKGTDSCQITASQGGVKKVSCDKGGQQIVMDTVRLDTVTVDKKYSTSPTPTVSEPQPPPAAATGKSGSCALIR